MNPVFKYMFGSAAILVAFALAGTVPVAGLYYSTADKIAANLQAARLRSINEVISADLYDNDILKEPISVLDENLLPGNTAATIYIARSQTEMVAAIFETIAPDGYSGSIRMLVGINVAGNLTGVRILEHRETPGLGDTIDQYHSDYLEVFPGKSLQNPVGHRWAVKKDGGDFDQLTGATITPRAVIKAIKRCLDYYDAHKSKLGVPPEQQNNIAYGKQ